MHTKIMRLFLLNPDKIYDVRLVMAISKGGKREVERELLVLEKIGLIKRKRYGKEGKGTSAQMKGYVLQNSFIYVAQLRSLLVGSSIMKTQDILKRVSRAGTLKLVVLAGIFIQNWDSRVDLLIVGDKLKKGLLGRVMRSMESEIGRELQYSILETSDLQYRMSVGDKLIRDIFDYPHQTILNKLGIEA